MIFEKVLYRFEKRYGFFKSVLFRDVFLGYFDELFDVVDIVMSVEYDIFGWKFIVIGVFDFLI